MPSDQEDRIADADSKPGNQPSDASFGPEELKEAEEKAVGRGSGLSTSTGGGNVNYTSGKGKHSGNSDFSTSTDGSNVNYDTSNNIPEAEASFYRRASSQSHKGRLRYLNFLSTRRRKTIFGGGLVGIVVGLIFGFTILQGPFQFIHIAQLLQQFHFISQQDASDDRFSKIVRYLHDPSKPQNTRLGIVGNKYANTIEARFNENGIETAYTKNFGYLDGYIINPEKFQGGMSQEEVKTYFKENYPGLTLTDRDGKLFVTTEGKDLFGTKSRTLIRSMMKETGYGKISGSVQARIMGRRAGVDWHPIKNLDSAIFKTLDAKLAEWRKIRTDDIEKGAAFADEQLTKDTSGAGSDQTAQQTAEANATDAESSASGTQDEARTAGAGASEGDPGAIAKFQDSLSVKLTTGGVAVAGVLCLAKGIDSDSANLKQAQVVLPLIRMGMEAITAGNQVMSGNGVDLDQLGFFSKLLSGKNAAGKNTSWVDAQSIQAELGKTGGVAASSTLTTIDKGTPFAFLNSGDFKTFLDPVCSTGGTIVQLAVSFIGGPISASLGLVVGHLLGPTVINQLAHWLAGQAVDLNAVGADYGNAINFGSRLAANDQAIAAGGRQLSDTEAGNLALFENAQNQKDFMGNSIAHRVFDPYDYRSTISRLIDQTKLGTSQNIASLAKNSFGIGHYLSTVSSLFAPKAKAAAAPYDYGFSQYGFSIDEINNPSVKNPYANAKTAVQLLEGSGGQTYIDNAKKCFGATIGKDADGNWGVDGGDTVPRYTDIDNSTCTSSDPNWTAIRFFIFDTQVMESMGCYLGDDQSCVDVGFDNTTASSSTTTNQTPTVTPAGTVPPPSASLQQLAKQVLADPNVVYPLDAVSPNGSTKVVLQTVAAGQPAPVTCTDGSTGGVTTADLNPEILQAILDIAKTGKVGVNALTDKCHTVGSNHYKGLAVDFECQGILFDVSKADVIAAKYGGQRNSETCSANSHWHYDFLIRP